MKALRKISQNELLKSCQLSSLMSNTIFKAAVVFHSCSNAHIGSAQWSFSLSFECRFRFVLTGIDQSDIHNNVDDVLSEMSYKRAEHSGMILPFIM